MHRTALTLSTISAIALACVLNPAPARAASNRTFVSGLGNDANPCSVSQPCRTMQAAFNATTPGGEIEALDPTGYGSLTITHSITIEGHGWASMNTSVAEGTVITVNAGSSDNIILRGLVLEGFGTAGGGIFFNTGGGLILEDSVVQNMHGTGLLFGPIPVGSPAPGTQSATLSVSNTRFTSDDNGVLLRPADVAVTGSFEHAIFDGNTTFGIEFDGTLGGSNPISVAMRDCAFTNNADTGVFAQGFGTNIVVRNATVARNSVGIGAIDNANVFVGDANITGNVFALAEDRTGDFTRGTIVSYGNNSIDGNDNDAAPVIIPLH